MTAEVGLGISAPALIDGISQQDLSEWLATMLHIREFEETADQLSLEGIIPGGVHTAIGQEAVAVGVIRALRPQDLVAGSHRTHHHALAKGLTTRSVMAELFGRATGCRGGRGGTIHLADMSQGYIGGNGIVGASVGIAMGAALAAQMRELDQIAVAFTGDGAANTGRTWEAINLAVIWSVPLIVVCENNRYAVETPAEKVTGGGSIASRAAGFGIRTATVDGQDVGAVYSATQTAVEFARSAAGPTFIEAMTFRFSGHNTGEDQSYRPREEVKHQRESNDPIDRLRRALEDAGLLDSGDFVALRQQAAAKVADAVQFAHDSPKPIPDPRHQDVTALDLRMRGEV